MKHPSFISITEFTYELPEEKIAQYPRKKRDESKLLVYKPGQKITDAQFKDLSNYLLPETLLVFNNTKVFPARLHFINDKGKPIEIFCLEPAGEDDVAHTMDSRGSSRWNCLVGHLRQWKQDFLSISKANQTLSATIVERSQNYVVIDFNWQPSTLTFTDILENFGAMPIPPYLNRTAEQSDSNRYQTVYASEKGSVAAPTAGLHFTPEVLSELKEKPVNFTEVTLHVGAGTFKPVKTATMLNHEMHAEWIDVKAEVVRLLLSNLEKNIIAVGTTSLRTIETLYWMGVKLLANPNAAIAELEIGQWDPYTNNPRLPEVSQSLSALISWMEKNKLDKLLCKTQILIAPPYELKIAKGIITNFHQPQSTLLLLISAITGDKWRDIYDHALQHDFRFLSYGDSSLLLK